MRKILYIICLAFIYFSSASCQEFKLGTSSCVYFIDSIEFDIVTLQIKNNTDENLLVWIEKNSTLGLSIDQKVKSYYFKNKGDFSLVQLVNENLKNELKPVLFSSFIKRLFPSDCFLISIIYKKESNKILESEIQKKMKFFFENNVVCMSQNTLIKYFDLEQFKSIYYKGNMLCINWNDLSQ